MSDAKNIAVVTDDELVSVLTRSLYPGADINSVKLVLTYCRAAGLDPMQKPVHIVPMWDRSTGSMRDVIMPGIGLYRTQAARGGEYAGVSEPEYGPDVTENIGGVDVTYPLWCKITVLRKLSGGVIAEFTAVERWKENYAVKGGKEKSIAPNAMWLRRPYGQLAKCTEAQALRKAFPEIGAQPTADEMEGKEYEPIDVTPKPPVTMPKAKEAEPISEPTEQPIKDTPQSEPPPKVVQGEVVAPTDSKPLGDNMLRVLKMQITGGKKSEAEVLGMFGVERLEEIPAAKINDVLKFVRG